ncbi:hypothetical protein JJE65_03810 [Alloprevotella tannerae]|uniref:hypothetical protein n=1 Tax=Alloprevotella tannerae TaxID=76122 RepID=UPI001EDC12EA|nr:hypothetical protein [Alloprevotella tannerae]MCG2648527.1 hypothetical protein [Alloprevotella tannerae]
MVCCRQTIDRCVLRKQRRGEKDGKRASAMKIQAPVVNEKQRSEALSGFQLSHIRQKQDEKGRR